MHTARRRLARLALVVLSVAFALYGLDRGISQMRDAVDFTREGYSTPALGDNDFGMFYGGAKLVRSADRADLYDLPTMVRSIVSVNGETPGADVDENGANRWKRYYNPPFFLLALSPLTDLHVDTAYVVVFIANLVLLVVLAGLLGAILRWRQPESLLLAVALFAASPVYFALHHGQPTILLAIFLAAGYLALRSQRNVVAGVLLALTGLKPHCLFPAAALLRPNPRLFLPLLAAGTLFLVLPFLLLGPGAVVDYVKLVAGRGSGDLSDKDYAGALLSWAGFFRAFTGEVRADLWFYASVGTLGLFALAWWRGSTEVVLAASVLTMLLVVPHSHPQDWVIVAPAAAVLLSASWEPWERAGIVAGLLGVFFGANDWSAAQMRMDAHGTSIYWVTLAAASLLVWITAVTLRRTNAFRLPVLADRPDASEVSG